MENPPHGRGVITRMPIVSYTSSHSSSTITETNRPKSTPTSTTTIRGRHPTRRQLWGTYTFTRLHRWYIHPRSSRRPPFFMRTISTTWNPSWLLHQPREDKNTNCYQRHITYSSYFDHQPNLSTRHHQSYQYILHILLNLINTTHRNKIQFRFPITWTTSRKQWIYYIIPQRTIRSNTKSINSSPQSY